MIQWNSPNPDSNETEEIVHISEVSLFQGLNFMQELFLEKQKVSLLERCSHSGCPKRGVLLYLYHICGC